MHDRLKMLLRTLPDAGLDVTSGKARYVLVRIIFDSRSLVLWHVD